MSKRRAVKIYHNKKLIDHKQFKRAFYIAEDSEGQIFWQADEEQAQARRGGEMLIWIRMPSQTIMSVRPGWQVILDEIVFPSQWYMDVDIKGKNIVLLYQNYEFVSYIAKGNE